MCNGINGKPQNWLTRTIIESDRCDHDDMHWLLKMKISFRFYPFTVFLNFFFLLFIRLYAIHLFVISSSQRNRVYHVLEYNPKTFDKSFVALGIEGSARMKKNKRKKQKKKWEKGNELLEEGNTVFSFVYIISTFYCVLFNIVGSTSSSVLGSFVKSVHRLSILFYFTSTTQLETEFRTTICTYFVHVM